MEEEDIPWAGLHHDGLPQDPDDGLQPLRVHRGQVPLPLVIQPAKLVRAGDHLQAAILPEHRTKSKETTKFCVNFLSAYNDICRYQNVLFYQVCAEG